MGRPSKVFPITCLLIRFGLEEEMEAIQDWIWRVQGVQISKGNNSPTRVTGDVFHLVLCPKCCNWCSCEIWGKDCCQLRYQQRPANPQSGSWKEIQDVLN